MKFTIAQLQDCRIARSQDLKPPLKLQLAMQTSDPLDRRTKKPPELMSKGWD